MYVVCLCISDALDWVHACVVYCRLVEETFTVDEVREMLEGLQAVVGGEVETELINTAHTNVLLLRQLFSQADKFFLRLQTDISELENRWGAWIEFGCMLLANWRLLTTGE